ncbi:hypothetical protein QTP88_027579 [Uroleucon formosanum]
MTSDHPVAILHYGDLALPLPPIDPMPNILIYHYYYYHHHRRIMRTMTYDFTIILWIAGRQKRDKWSAKLRRICV